MGGARKAVVLVSPTLARPVTTGVFRTTVLLPQDLCDRSRAAQCEAVLLHELAHVDARDTALLLIASILRIGLFIHPLFWLLWRDLRLNQELLADAWAAHRIGSAASYAERLVRLATHSQPLLSWTLPVLQAVRRRSELYQRMEFLLRSERQTALTISRRAIVSTSALMLLVGASGAMITIRAAHTPPPLSATGVLNAATASDAERRGLAFLRAAQESTGGWLSATGPGVTALAVRALLQSGDSLDSPPVRRGLEFIESTHQSDGGYYTSTNPSYNTALVVSMLATLPGNQYQGAILRGRHFLESLQTADHPPLPNAGKFYHTFASRSAISSDRLPQVDALSEANPLIIQSPGDRTDDATFSTNSTLTYMQLKSLLYAGLTPSDPRVTALIHTLQAHFTVDHNPLYESSQGQYYFYYVASKALRAYGSPLLFDTHHHPHDWRNELVARLASQQSADGSWVNRGSNYWLENTPVLVTTYTVLALQETRR